MAVKASDIKGLDIFSLSDKKSIKKAKEVLFNSEAKKVEGVVVDESGIMSEGKAILIGDIKSIGSDAIVVESKSVIKKESELPENIKKLVKEKKGPPKVKMMTKDGQKLGKASDFLFNPDSGEIEEIKVSGGKQLIKAEDIISIGVKSIVVKAGVKKKDKSESEDFGAQKVINKVTKKVKQIPGVQKAAEKVKQVTGYKEEDGSPPPKGKKQDNGKDKKTNSAVKDLKAEGIEVRGKTKTKDQSQDRLRGSFDPNKKT